MMNLYARRKAAIAVIEAECRIPVPSPFPSGSCIGLAIQAASMASREPITLDVATWGESVPDTLKAALRAYRNVKAAWKVELARYGWREVTDSTVLPFDLLVTNKAVAIVSADYMKWGWNDSGFGFVHDFANYITLRIP